MPVISRSYQHPHDFDRLTRFLSQVYPAVQQTHYLHPGDLTWQLFHMLVGYVPADLVHIWEDMHGDIVGFVLLFPAYGGFEVQLRPQERGTMLEKELLQWAEQHLPATGRRSTLVNDNDTARLTLLTRRGYTPNGGWLYLERPLHEALPPVHVPPGFVVRSLLDDQEATARAIVLGAAFEAPPLPERYQHLMHAPGYVRDLDLVAVAPDERFAAFAMCWVDRGSRVGQFEPVGTAPEFRRHGLAQAVLLGGLRRMQQHGAERAIVIVEAAEEAATRLYESVGFRNQWNLTWYTQSTTEDF